MLSYSIYIYIAKRDFMCVGGICVCVFAIFDCIELPQFNFAS